MDRTVDRLRLVTHTVEQTQSIGHMIGEHARPGNTVLLVGDLGSGKTCLTQGIALGLGVTANVVSPSFVLVREYRGRLPLYHVDLYRLDSVAEIADLGLDEYLYVNGLCVVEWADKGCGLLPEDHLLVQLGFLSSRSRSIVLTAHAPDYEHLLAHLSEHSHSAA